jgi:hypothetical protein
MALETQIVNIDFGQGIDQKSDSKQVLATNLTQLENRTFDKIKQLKKSKGFDRLTNNILGGGTITSATSLATLNDELLMVTPEKLYSYSEDQTAWVDRGDMSPLKVTTETVHASATSQKGPQVVLQNGLFVYVWEDTNNGVQMKVVDATTKNVLLAETVVRAGALKPVLTQISANVVACYYVLSTDIRYRTFDTSSPASGLSGEATAVSNNLNRFLSFDVVFDVNSTTSNVLLYCNNSSQVGVAKLNSSGAISSCNDRRHKRGRGSAVFCHRMFRCGER